MRNRIYSFTVGALLGMLFAFTYPSPGDNGFATGEVVGADSMNAIETALDAIETVNSSQATSISTLTSTFASYLPLAGGDITGPVTVSSGGSIAVGTGATIGPVGSGAVRATVMSATGQIDDNDLAASAVDGGTGGEIQDETVTGADILNDGIVLITDTAGNFVQTITGDSEITVSGAGTEGRDVTLAIASTLARDAEVTSAVAAVSTTSSTNTAIPRFSGTSGDLQDSGVTIDGSNNITSAGNLLMGGSTGGSTFTMRNTADSGWVECGVVSTTMTCATDADGTPDGSL